MSDRFNPGDSYRGKEVVNIQSRAENPDAKILSNLADTPFEYGDYSFQCVEAALQGIKFEDRKKREEVFKMSGRNALSVGREITNSIKDGEKRFVYWMDKKFAYNSDEHRELLAEFIRAKIRQNADVQEALLNLKDKFIYHYVGEESPHTSLPEKFYMKILVGERKNQAVFKELRIDVFNYLKEIYKNGLTYDDFKNIFKEVFNLSEEKITELFNETSDQENKVRVQELKDGLKKLNEGRWEGICKILAILGLAYLKKKNIKAKVINLKSNEKNKDKWGIETQYGSFSPYNDKIIFDLENE